MIGDGHRKALHGRELVDALATDAQQPGDLLGPDGVVGVHELRSNHGAIWVESNNFRTTSFAADSARSSLDRSEGVDSFDVSW